jgi:hypothetical protein
MFSEQLEAQLRMIGLPNGVRRSRFEPINQIQARHMTLPPDEQGRKARRHLVNDLIHRLEMFGEAQGWRLAFCAFRCRCKPGPQRPAEQFTLYRHGWHQPGASAVDQSLHEQAEVNTEIIAII